jgi:hypothetical protein
MDVEQIINNRVVQTASIGVASFAAGVGIGYVIGKRRGSTVVYVPEQFTSEHYVEEDISDQVEDEVEETDEQLLDSADVEEVSSDEVETEEEVILPHIDDDTFLLSTSLREGLLIGIMMRNWLDELQMHLIFYTKMSTLMTKWVIPRQRSHFTVETTS